MSFPRGSFPRMAVSALLAPLGPALCMLPVLEAWRRTHRGGWGVGSIESAWDFLLVWLGVSLLVSVVGLLLRAWNRIALRHHLLTTLAIGALPLLLTLLDWRMSQGETAHTCAELFRDTAYDLPGKVTTALLMSMAGVAFKWLAYGRDREFATRGWQIAGAAYILVLLIDIGGQLGQISGAFPTWSEAVSRTCE